MTAPTTTDPTVHWTPAGTLLIALSDDTVEVTLAEAQTLARSLREHVYLHAAEMIRVVGKDDGATIEVIADDDVPVYAAEGWDLAYGLECPHRCGHIGWDDDQDAVIIVDEDERWSRAGYHRVTDHQGATTETVATGGADTNYEGLGYRCPTCSRPVTLPAGIEETWT